MLLQLRQIRYYAQMRLKQNFGKAVWLIVISLITLVLTAAIGQGAVWALDAVLLEQGLFVSPSMGTITATLISLFVNLLVLSPLFLNLKKWYSTLQDYNPTVGEALSIFATLKTYINAVWYSLIKAIWLFAGCICLFLPSVIIAAVIRTWFSTNGINFGILTAAIILLFMVFVLLGLIYTCYFTLGFFYADYIFLSGKTQNPFKAISRSFQLTGHRRKELILLYLSLLPMLLSCLLIVPIVFVWPYIKSTLAFFANEQLCSRQ